MTQGVHYLEVPLSLLDACLYVCIHYTRSSEVFTPLMCMCVLLEAGQLTTASGQEEVLAGQVEGEGVIELVASCSIEPGICPLLRSKCLGS